MSLQRIIVQSLEAWRLAGVTDLPHLDVPPTSSAPPGRSAQKPPPEAAVNSRTPLQPPDALRSTPPILPTAAVAGTDIRPLLPIPNSQNESESEMARKRATSTTQRAPDQDRAAALQILSQRVADCRKCKELASTRTQTVFGVGNPHARIVFVGEAPGADEDRQGEPFVGRAGQLLNKIIEACKLRRDDIYICNILKCRPPENRTPLPDECSNCREFLEAQLHTIAPEYIVCWGTVASQNLLNATTPISKLRGRFFEYGTSKVLCTYHPSYLLRNPPAKKDVWEDMKLLFNDMGIELK